MWEIITTDVNQQRKFYDKQIDEMKPNLQL
jgi:hypothetical protein